MTLGTGIFLSTACILIVVLYVVTKDRWRWRRLGTWGIRALVGLCVLWGIAYAYNSFAPIGRQTEYDGLRLGMTASEVRYIKGQPSAVYEPPSQRSASDPPGDWRVVVAVKDIPKEKRITDYMEWSFDQQTSRLDVTFDKPGGTLVEIGCYSKDRYLSCTPIGGIRDGARFGKPDTSVIDGVSKRTRFKDAGAYFVLTQQKVYMLGISQNAE